MVHLFLSSQLRKGPSVLLKTGKVSYHLGLINLCPVPHGDQLYASLMESSEWMFETGLWPLRPAKYSILKFILGLGR